MFSSLACECHLKLAKSVAELGLTGARELRALLSIEHEVELRDRLHLKSLAGLAIVVSLHGAEDYVLVLIGAAGSLKRRLKPHARRAARRPKVYHYALVVADNCLQLHIRGDVADFAERRRRSCSLLLLGSLVLLCGRLVLLLLLLLLLILLDKLALLWSQHLKHGRIVHHLFKSGRHRRQLLLLPLSLLFLARLAHPQGQSLLVIVKQLIGSQCQTLLHVDHHWCNLLAQLRLVKLAGQLGVLARDPLAGDELGYLVCEGIAVVREDMVGALSVLL